jgi:hypothetical protein
MFVIHDLKKADPVFFLCFSYFSLMGCFRFTKNGFVEGVVRESEKLL